VDLSALAARIPNATIMVQSSQSILFKMSNSIAKRFHACDQCRRIFACTSCSDAMRRPIQAWRGAHLSHAYPLYSDDHKPNLHNAESRLAWLCARCEPFSLVLNHRISA